MYYNNRHKKMPFETRFMARPLKAKEMESQ